MSSVDSFSEKSMNRSSDSRRFSRMFRAPDMPVSFDSSVEDLAYRCFTVDSNSWPVANSYEEQLRSRMLDTSSLVDSSSGTSDDLLFESDSVDVPSVEVTYEGSRFERLDAAFEARCVDQMNAARTASIASLSKETEPPVPPAPAPSPAPAPDSAD